jgi:pyridoxamine 5'-phosphate oxidase
LEAFLCFSGMENTVTINQIRYGLEEILQDCWHRLINGAISAKHPFHCPSIATANGDLPEIRTVVLRKVLPEERSLIFHTDYRSPKINQIKTNNTIAWLFYDARARIQLRLKTRATIHYHDEIALSRWNDSKLESRKCYLVVTAPSTMAESPSDGLPEDLDRVSLTEESVTPGYDNFAVVRNKVMEIDWLYLNHDGHRRARFLLGDKGVDQHWLIP